MKICLIARKNPEPFRTSTGDSLKIRETLCLHEPSIAGGRRARLRATGVVLCRERAMAFIANRGSSRASRLLASRDDPAVVACIAWVCVLRRSATLSLCRETAWRRPRAIDDAFTLALLHKPFSEYARTTSQYFETVIHDLLDSEPGGTRMARAPSAAT